MSLASDDRSIEYRLATLGGPGNWSVWAGTLGIQPVVLAMRGSGWAGLLVDLFEMLRAERPDIVYVIGLRAAISVRLLRPFSPNIHVVHGIRSSFPAGSGLARRFRIAERLFKGLTKSYIANSSAGADTIAEMAGIRRRDIRVIPNGMDVADRECAEKLKAKVIAVVANLHPLKGHKQFLDVVELVKAQHPDVVVRLIGRDDLNGEIQHDAKLRKLDDVVQFCGFQADVAPFLAEATIFVLPSRITEGAPTSILEAFVSSLPVVAYAVGGVPELIRDGVDGFLIKQGDDAAMADAIIRLLADPARAELMGRAGREKVVREFSLRACAERHSQAWREICAERSMSQ